MSILYAFINQTQYDMWTKTHEPSVERFLREVGTTRFKYSKDVLVTPFVAVKSSGCVRLIQKYPVVSSITPQEVSQPQSHGFFCRVKKFLGMKH